jgi:hypothetical protein
MATITNATLTLAHNHDKRTVKATAKCRVNFTALELCQMKNCTGARFFKLKCQLWGEDGGLTFGDDFLYTYQDVFYFPDTTPTASEDRTFDVLLGEGVLDEDWGTDEVYALFKLINVYTTAEVKKKSNTVSHNF